MRYCFFKYYALCAHPISSDIFRCRANFLRDRQDRFLQLSTFLWVCHDYLDDKDQTYHFIIEDNGVGRKATSYARQDDKKSYGMEISRDRVKLFNKEDNASVFITDLEKDGKATGTKVDIFLNI